MSKTRKKPTTQSFEEKEVEFAKALSLLIFSNGVKETPFNIAILESYFEPEKTNDTLRRKALMLIAREGKWVGNYLIAIKKKVAQLVEIEKANKQKPASERIKPVVLPPPTSWQGRQAFSIVHTYYAFYKNDEDGTGLDFSKPNAKAKLPPTARNLFLLIAGNLEDRATILPAALPKQS